MRLVTLVLFFSSALWTQAQVWEKPIAPGLIYRMEVDLKAPRLIHAVRWSPSSKSVEALPELGQGAVFTQDVAKSRATVTEMVASSGSIGGVNADFFPWTGDPIGLMVRGDEIWSIPYRNRGAFAWSKTATKIGASAFLATLQIGGKAAATVTGINQECNEDELVVNAAAAGFARSKSPGTMVVAKIVKGSLTTLEPLEVVVERKLSGQTNIPVLRGTICLAANGASQATLDSLKVGDNLKILVSVPGFDWKELDHAVAGGPFLLRNGKVDIDAKQQGFGQAFSDTRHPRTAVGTTPHGDVWFVVVDGRQSMSVGASLPELAQIMLDLGCDDALNLDGGGSSAMNLRGMTLNRPSDGNERPVANGVVFSGPVIQSGIEKFKLEAPEKMKVGEKKTLILRDELGGRVRDQEILWSATGSAWIDQGGFLRAVAPGPCKVRAWCRGSVTELTIEVATS